jgi:hypothetical protein
MFPDVRRWKEEGWIYYGTQPKAGVLILRYYFNTTFAGLGIAEDLLEHYQTLPKPKGVMQLKFSNPNVIDEGNLTRCERIVLYISDRNTGVAMAAKIKSLPQKFFHKKTPRFTHNIARGRSWAYNPTKKGHLKSLIWELGLEDDTAALSYGYFMAHAIALASHGVFSNYAGGRNREIQFENVPKQDLRNFFLPRIMHELNNYMRSGLHV